MARAEIESKAASGNLAKVAQKAKVSTGTVSRVFNNSTAIPSETKRRVLAVARELGFSPRVGVRKKQIALITEPPWKTVMGGYVNTLTQYICFALSRADVGIAMITEDNISSLNDSWYDGIIGIAWEAETIDRLKKIKNLPVIWLSDEHAGSFHSIYLDARKTGMTAGAYLLGKGHRKIAVIHETDHCGNGRADGLAEAMRQKGLDPDASLLRLPCTLPVQVSVKQLLDGACTAVWVTGTIEQLL